MMLSRIFDLLAQFGGNLRSVGRSGAQNHLCLRRQVADRIDQMRHALLARDAADKQNVGHCRIHAIIRSAPVVSSVF